MALLTIEDPTAGKPASPTFALFALGFRPFYLLAAAFAAIAIPAWVLTFSGAWVPSMPGVLWHAHEMLFGFATAVIVGFLFTAGRNWTGLPTPTGWGLAALSLLWLAGRFAILVSGEALAAFIDSLFLPAAALALAWVLVKAESRRNYFIVGLLAALALVNLSFHLARLGVIGIEPLRPLWCALALITVLETTMGGRVIPMFTASALRGVRQWQHPRLNQAAIVATAVSLLFWAMGGDGLVGATFAMLAALLQTLRCAGWNPWATRKTPLLWVLHLAHGWIPVGLLLIGLSQLGWVSRSAAVHALAVGAMGGLIMGMITRTALGHTGRMLIAGTAETVSYALISCAALVRVGSVLWLPQYTANANMLAAALWSAAFALYFVRYLPWLIRARPDGRPG